MAERVIHQEALVFHMACGLGGGARGARKAKAVLGHMRLSFRNIGGVDIDPASIRDFDRLSGVKGTVLDLFTRDQYVAFHGKPPPPGWREATPQDIRDAAGGERPNVAFISAPCKGLSGLLPEATSKSLKYQALNQLTLRCVWLLLEAWSDDPPEFILFENVPRIATRGRPLLDQIGAIYAHYGYAFAETKHDCGELGNLAQSRKRFLMVARHRVKVPAFLYEPEKRPLRGVGEVLDLLPLPGDPRAGPMHRMPALQWKTWVRLAFVPAGKDWRALNDLRVKDGLLQDFGIAPDHSLRNGAFGVNGWGDTPGVVAGESLPSNGRYSVADPKTINRLEGSGHLGVRGWEDSSQLITGDARPSKGPFSLADPRIDGHPRSVQLGVRAYADTGPVVTGDMWPGCGPNSIADPRPHYKPSAHQNIFRVVAYNREAGTVIGADHITGGAAAVADARCTWGADSHRNKFKVTPYEGATGTIAGADRVGSGAPCVADPRAPEGRHVNGKYRVTPYEGPANAVIAGSTTGQGAFVVADPTPYAFRNGREHYTTGGHYGVTPWAGSANAIPAFAKNNNGPWSVADPRDQVGDLTDFRLPAAEERLVCVIRALDNTWHRPFTTLELAALQTLVDPEEVWAGGWNLDGVSDSAKRERIGNAVPADAAEAMFSEIGRTLLLARAGETFKLSNTPIWVRGIAVALAVDIPELPA